MKEEMICFMSNALTTIAFFIVSDNSSIVS